jgi:SAM-dependent methyltransferase
MDNYQFCAEFAVRHCPAGGKVLDYGCGMGQIVSLMRQAGLDAYGCEAFYAGGDVRNKVPAEMLGVSVLEIVDGRIPFADQTFDLVLSNQVIEHVEDLDSVLHEIVRVLKPNGIVLSVFPHLETWREGHSGIPMLHRFPKGNARVYYALMLRSLGFGYFKNGKSRTRWAVEFCQWIDSWCHYRPYRDIVEIFGRYFGPIRHIEDEWVSARLGDKVRRLPRWMRIFIARKWGNIVFVCSKPPDAARQAPGAD